MWCGVVWFGGRERGEKRTKKQERFMDKQRWWHNRYTPPAWEEQGREKVTQSLSPSETTKLHGNHDHVKLVLVGVVVSRRWRTDDERTNERKKERTNEHHTTHSLHRLRWSFEVLVYRHYMAWHFTIIIMLHQTKKFDQTTGLGPIAENFQSECQQLMSFWIDFV